MDPRTEEQLFNDFRRNGDLVALSELFERTSKDLLRLALHLASNLPDAEDLVQETFVAAIESACRFHRGTSLRGWLVKILQNRARRLHRTRQRDRRRSELHDEARVSQEPAAVDLAGQRDLRTVVHAAVASLEEPYRTVVGLHAKHGFTAKEISAALSRSVDTVRSQLTRGLGRLESRLPSQAALAAAPFSTLSLVSDRVLAHASQQAPAAVFTRILPGKILSALVVVLLVVIPAYVWFGGQETPLPATFERVAETRAPARVEDGTANSPSRTAVPAGQPARGGSMEDSVRFRVRDRATGRPVEGATVRFWGRPFRQMDLSVGEFKDEYSYLYYHDREALLRRYGQHVETDADGVFTVSGSTSLSDMTARKGGLFGRRSRNDENEIYLNHDEQLTVRVLSAEGLPVAGVNVRIVREDGRPFPSPSYLRFPSLARTTTQGLAVFPHLQLLRTELEARGESEVKIRVAVRVAAKESRTVDVASLGSKVIECKLAAARPVQVRLWDGLGQQILPNQNDDDPQVELGGWAMRAVDEGWVLHHVPVGKALTLSASWRGVVSETRQVTVDAAKEHSTIDLRFGRDVVSLVGRATDAARQPLRNVHLDAVSTEGDTAQLSTDAEGRFVFFGAAGGPARPNHPQSVVELQVVDARYERTGWSAGRRPLNLSARVSFVAATPGSKQRLGDVVFRAVPVIGEGTVHFDPPSLRSRLAPTAVRVREFVGEQWLEVPASGIQWGQSGSFTVFGRTLAKRLRVTSKRIQEGSLFVPGLDAEFSTHDAGMRWEVALPGQVILDLHSATANPEVRFSVERIGVALPVEIQSNHMVRPLSFGETGVHVQPVLGPLVPGTYRIKVLGSDGRTELRVLDRVEVGVGGRARPMLTSPLDLR